jgi:hypothetical protein
VSTRRIMHEHMAALVTVVVSVLIAALSGAIVLRRVYTNERRRIAAKRPSAALTT